jgi:hypothetical protein
MFAITGITSAYHRASLFAPWLPLYVLRCVALYPRMRNESE